MVQLYAHGSRKSDSRSQVRPEKNIRSHRCRIGRRESGGSQPAAVFFRAIGATFGEGEEGGGVEGDGERAAQVVVEEDVVDDQASAILSSRA